LDEDAAFLGFNSGRDNINEVFNKMNICSSLVVVAILALAAGLVFGESINTIQIKKISPEDQKAIVKSSDGKIKMIGLGDTLGDGRVTEISENKIVVEKKTDAGPEKIIIRFENGKQQVERLSRVPESKPHLVSSLTGSRK